ncbi:unnamed protein product, partial [Staurois parvus]
LTISIPDTFTPFLSRPVLSFQRYHTLNDNCAVMQRCTHMKIDEYILAKIYEERLFICKILMFGLFHFYSKNIKIPVVNKYHQNKVLSVSKM